MLYLKSILIILIITLIYIYLSSTGVVAHAGIAQIFVTLALTFEQTTYALSGLWYYLVDNSFCPWIMIVRGRSMSTILIEASDYINSITSDTSLYNAFIAVTNSIISICELFIGPAIGIITAFLQIFFCYKASILTFTKIFNKKIN